MFKGKTLPIFVIFLIVISILGHRYMYKSHRDISMEKADFSYTSDDLIEEFSNNVDLATKKFLDKTIQLSGQITEIETENFTLNNSIICYSDSLTIKHLKLMIRINVKGRSIGYDELLDDIKLDQVHLTMH
jgi:hypothetical protein